MQEQNDYKYRYFVYIFIVCYVLINHSFSKTCVILGSFLDKRLLLPIGTNIMTIGSSTAFSAIGKFVGVFIEGSKKKIIIFSFFFNAICMFFCITTFHTWVFIVARTMQGFFAGLQMSLLFGLIGTLHNCKTGFVDFTTISSVVCLSTGILLYFLDPITIVWGLIGLNMAFGIFFWQIAPFKDTAFLMKLIDWTTIKNLIKNKEFLIKTSFLGFFLGCVFLAIDQQKETILNVFNIKYDKLSNTLSSITFLASGITSFFTVFHSLYLFNIMNFVCVWCVFLGLATKSIYIFLAGIFLPFCCFSIVNPIVMEEVTLSSSNRFISSAFASCFRSLVTSAVICIMPHLSESILETSIICMFTSGLFFTFFYGKTGK